ncbi:MAG: hypothetical protein AB7E80_08360 [Hyphomicrobiaceae bacterium]
MKILLVGSVDAWTRSVATMLRYARVAGRLGHDVALYGKPVAELPDLPGSESIDDADLVVFVLQLPRDIPDMPGLARLLDRVPEAKRVVIDLWGRHNETIRIDHDFNHLESFDGHPSWEWHQAIAALGGRIVQPTLNPRRADVGSFLFHGFAPDEIAVKHATAEDAARAWTSDDRGARPYGVVYVGSNWQRWTQVRAFLEGYREAAEKVGQVCLAGWDWAERPSWAVELALAGVDTDADLLADLRVEVRMGVRFDRVVPLLAQGRFAPVFHRPLFNELGFVTNRTFETFLADSVPVLMLPPKLVERIYGPAALKLVPKAGVAHHLTSMLDDPVAAWRAVMATREHLAEHHSMERRFAELVALRAGSKAMRVAS